MSTWDGRRVLVTGHTGFKGGWLSLELARRGATVIGFSDAVPTEPSLFEEAGLAAIVEDRRGDVGDAAAVLDVLTATRPSIVFHLAAQPLVRRSYVDPVGTWRTNVLGTLHVLDAARQAGTVEAAVVVTTDKCYRQPSPTPFVEDDPLGGHDPYSASKAGAELAVASWRATLGAEPALRVATARGGNVLGGGDWSPDRLVPDLVRAGTTGTTLVLRNPTHVRPWQDVLDCIAGYLLLGEALVAGDAAVGPWNFAPQGPDGDIAVDALVSAFASRWGKPLDWRVEPDPTAPHEEPVLRLDSSHARRDLGWTPRLRLEDTIDRLVEWYGTWADGGDVAALSRRHLQSYDELGAT